MGQWVMGGPRGSAQLPGENDAPLDWGTEFSCAKWVGGEAGGECTSVWQAHICMCRRRRLKDEAQTGIKIAERSINNVRYADDTTLMAKSKEELKSPLRKVKEESGKVGLKLNIQKAKIMASSPITSWQIYGETMETVRDYFLGIQNHCRSWLQPWN